MKEASKLAHYEDKLKSKKLIHKDIENFKLLKIDFDDLFNRAEQNASIYNLYELI